MNFKICQVDCVNGAAAVICICLGYSHLSYGMGVVSGMGSSRELGLHCSMQNGHQKDCSRGKEGQACTEPQTRHWVPCHVEGQFEGVRSCGPGVRFWGARAIGSWTVVYLFIHGIPSPSPFRSRSRSLFWGWLAANHLSINLPVNMYVYPSIYICIFVQLQISIYTHTVYL